LTTELLIAPPAAGKTEACIQRIKTVQFTQPLSKVWVLVPDRKTAAYFRLRLAASGGGIGVIVGTYRDLYRDILERNGIFTPTLTPALEHRLVQETVDGAFDCGDLVHYASIKSKPGFILALQDCFAELRISYISPERFIEYTLTSTPARHELAILYARFVTRLQELNWIDQEGQSWLAISALEANRQAAVDIHLVVADGFSLFSGALRHFIRLLSEQAGETLITLPGVLGSNRPVHRRTRAMIEILQRELAPKVSELTSSPRLPTDNLHLEQHVLDPVEFNAQEASRPILIEARSQSEEVREVLRWIKELNKRQKLPMSACAIFTSNLETYQPLLRATAMEFGINVHFSHPDPLAESPAVLALLNLLSLPQVDYQTRNLMNTLHSPYFNLGLDAKLIEDLEKVTQEASIVKGKDQWTDAWKMLMETKSGDSDDLDEERWHEPITQSIDLNMLRNAFDRFWHLFDSISQICSLSEWVTWLEWLLEDLHFQEKLIGERDQEAYESLGEALKALVLSESVVGIRKLDYAQFLSDLQGVLAGARLDEPKENQKNSLLVAGLVEARATRFKAVALLGFSEGLFPEVENPDPFLDENLRRDLGMESRLQREQTSIFYQAFTRADEYLLITRPYLIDDGSPWEASPYWLAAKRLFTDSALMKIKADTPRAQAEAASAQELVFWGIQQNQLDYQTDHDMVVRWQAIQKAGDILNLRRSKVPKGAYDGYLDQVASILAAQYSTERRWSASRLETYGTCPHEFLVSNVLKLSAKTLPELGMDAIQLGSMLHRILERVYRDAPPGSDTQYLLDKLDEVTASVFQKAPFIYGFRPSPLWEVEKGQWVEKLQQTIQVLEDESAGWKPVSLEQKFGIGGTPALALNLGSETIRLHGFIDRVDKNSRGEIRVIDYKTGGANLDKASLDSGRRLQLPIYAIAARDALQLGEVVEGFYWKIGAAAASSLKLSKYKSDDDKGPEAAYRTALEQIRRILAGIRSGEFPPIPPKGGCPSYCPAVQWCWRYEAGFSI
jgi:ATP-dependent helicase/DNAse subunit B